MNTFEKPILVFVGGLLGAGKTTLILRAARLLQDRGQRVAVIMNDQDTGLVDSHQSLAERLATREVSGGCFCCRFSDLIEAAEQLNIYDPQVIFAEPVGSCVDLSATILQPLLHYHAAAYRIAPLTVLFDPGVLKKMDEGKVQPDLEYLFRHQLAEADLICCTKTDIYPGELQTPFPIDFHLSGQSGEGVAVWLDEVLASKRVVGAHILDVDYARYAAAEAALGWFNLQAELHFINPTTPALVVGPLLERLHARLISHAIQIAHLKIFDSTQTGWIRASLTMNGSESIPQGDLLADPAVDHRIAINLRALSDPALLKSIVLEVLDEFGGQWTIGHVGAFRPPPPIPQHRFRERSAAKAQRDCPPGQ